MLCTSPSLSRAIGKQLRLRLTRASAQLGQAWLATNALVAATPLLLAVRPAWQRSTEQGSTGACLPFLNASSAVVPAAAKPCLNSFADKRDQTMVSYW